MSSSSHRHREDEGVPSDDQFVKVAEYRISRVKAGLYATAIGVLLGFVNTYMDIDLSLRLGLLGWVLLAIVVVVSLHEGTHGAVASLLGHRPVFGLEPPLVYVTFADKIPRGQLIAIALAPLVLLDLIFVALYTSGILKLFASLCFSINTLGAAGDVWVVLMVARYQRGTFVQDTKTGLEIWRASGSQEPPHLGARRYTISGPSRLQSMYPTRAFSGGASDGGHCSNALGA